MSSDLFWDDILAVLFKWCWYHGCRILGWILHEFNIGFGDVGIVFGLFCDGFGMIVALFRADAAIKFGLFWDLLRTVWGLFWDNLFSFEGRAAGLPSPKRPTAYRPLKVDLMFTPADSGFEASRVRLLWTIWVSLLFVTPHFRWLRQSLDTCLSL